MSYGLSLLPVHYNLFTRQSAQCHTGWPLCCCLLPTRRAAEPRDKRVLPRLRFASDGEPVVLPPCGTFALQGRELLLHRQRSNSEHTWGVGDERPA